jgi:hypothetical protein
MWLVREGLIERVRMQRGGAVFVMLDNRNQEAIAAAVESLDVSRRFGRIAEGRAQLGHGLVQAAVEIDEGVGGPKFLAEFLSGNQFAGTFEEQREDLEGLLLQPDSNSVLAKLTGAKLNFKNAKPQSPGRTLSGIHSVHP